jgi:hypothetical protein
MTFIEILKKRWYVCIAIFVVIILLLNWYGFITLFGKESFSTVHLSELNDSVVPQGKSISLTEEDFKQFPQLASIIRDKNQNAAHSYTILFTADEYNWFVSRYWSNISEEDKSQFPPRRIFEYEGKYYIYDYPQIH